MRISEILHTLTPAIGRAKVDLAIKACGPVADRAADSTWEGQLARADKCEGGTRGRMLHNALAVLACTPTESLTSDSRAILCALELAYLGQIGSTYDRDDALPMPVEVCMELSRQSKALVIA